MINKNIVAIGGGGFGRSLGQLKIEKYITTLVENPEEVWNSLKKVNIESRPLICGSMGLQPFWTIQNKKQSNFKIADQIHYKGIYLPINADLNEEDILFVCEKFKEVAKVYKQKL